MIANTKCISEWKSKGFSDESIKPPATSDNTLSPLIDYHGNKLRLKFNGCFLKQQEQLKYTPSTIESICIVYEVAASSCNNDDPTLRNSLFG